MVQSTANSAAGHRGLLDSSAARRSGTDVAPRIPIIIGVTGHRDLRTEDSSRLEELVRAFFAEIEQSCPHSPLVVLSSLAEGSDRLVARVALGMGYRLVVPLPMPLVEYQRDCTGEESRAELAGLLAYAADVFEVGDPQRDMRTVDWSRQENRKRAYALASAWISRHSQVILALWDGRESDAEGGTAHAVRFELQGITSSYSDLRSLLDPVESGAVYQIVTPRRSNPVPAGEPFTARWRYPEACGQRAWSERSYRRILERLDAFNRDVVRLGSRSQLALGRSREFLFPTARCEELVPGTYEVERLHYAAADALAIECQRRSRTALVGLLSLCVTSYIVLQIYAELFPHQSAVLLLFLVLLLAVAGLQGIIRRRAYRNRHLDYRALAEGLRVQFFWRLANLPDLVADYHLRKHSGEMEWIREALRSVNLLSQSRGRTGSPGESKGGLSCLRLTRDFWVRDQLMFYDRAGRRDRRRKSVLECIAWVLYGIGVLMAAALFLWHGSRGPGAYDQAVQSFAMITIGVSLALAASCVAYAEKSVLSEQARQYHRMHELFARALSHLDQMLSQGNLCGARAVLRELGKEALVENGDWVLLHRSREIDIRQGG